MPTNPKLLLTLSLTIWLDKANDLEAVAKHAQLPKANTRPRTVIFNSHGLEPTIVVTHDHTTGENSVKSYPVRELAAEKVKDNGAGRRFSLAADAWLDWFKEKT